MASLGHGRLDALHKTAAAAAANAEPTRTTQATLSRPAVHIININRNIIYFRVSERIKSISSLRDRTAAGVAERSKAAICYNNPLIIIG